jgi:hypothetical protein
MDISPPWGTSYSHGSGFRIVLSWADDRNDHLFAVAHKSGSGRFCCKSLFAPVIKNFPGRRRDFRVKMWGTSSPDDKVMGDLPNEIEATQIGGFRSDCVIAGKLAPGSFGVLQQYRHIPEEPITVKQACSS